MASSLTGSSYGDVLFQLNNPSDQFQKFQAQDEALHSNSLEDAVRQNNIDIGKQQAQQEAIKTQEIARGWEAQKAYADALKNNIKLTPAPGYEQPTGPPPAPTGTNAATGRPSLSADNGNQAGSAATISAPVVPNSMGSAIDTSAASVPVVAPPPADAANTMAAALNPPASQTAPVTGSPGPTVPPPAVPPEIPGLEPLKPMNPNDPATYKVLYDQAGINDDLTKAGYGPEAIAYSQERQKALTAAIDGHIKALDETGKRMGILSNALTAVPLTDFNETDPQKLQQQQQASQLGAIQQLRYAVQNGGIDPSQEKGLEQQIMAGWTPQLQQQVKALGASATAAHEQHIDALDQAKEHREQVTAGSQTAERAATTLKTSLGNASQTVASVDSQTALDNWYNRQPPAVKDAVKDVYQKGYSPQTVQALSEMGMTADQKAVIQVRKDAQQATEEYRDDSLALRRELRDKTSAGDRADQRQAQTKLIQLQGQEEPLYGQMAQLQSAIDSGKVYVTKTGQVQPLTIANRGDETINDYLKTDMEDRLEGLKNQASSIVNEKYDLVEQHGGQPKVSREDALKGIGAKAPAKTQAPAPVTAPAKPAPAGTQKYTEAQVRAAAAAKGKDADAAVAAARSKNLLQ